jgi:DNA-binding MarR family transcriptional regulator
MSTKWLTPAEMRAWRAYIETTTHLRAAFEADLAPHGLTLGDYEVLVILSEADDGAVRMCDLSESLGLSPSGLTRRLDGLVKAGYVQRAQCTNDRRVMFASITPSGATVFKAAVDDHVGSVRAHLIDRLTPDQVEVFADIFTSVGVGLGRPPALSH